MTSKISVGVNSINRHTVIRLNQMFIVCVGIVFGSKNVQFYIICTSIKPWLLDPHSDSLYNGIMKLKNCLKCEYFTKLALPTLLGRGPLNLPFLELANDCRNDCAKS